ncbi:MAG: hypothetical protein ACRC8S_22295 [Fimbriiglobus sp.]
MAPESLGGWVSCPHCRQPFQAKPPAPPVPTIYPRRAAQPALDHHEPVAPNAILVAFSLSPLGIPFLWLILPLITKKEPLFTFAAPTAMALGLVGLCLGVTHAANWTTGTRLRAIIMLSLMGYGTASFLLFMKREWAVAVAKRMLPPQVNWKNFEPENQAYKVRLPGTPTPRNVSPLPGWELKTYAYESPDAVTLELVIAEGSPPESFQSLKTDDEWFGAVREEITKIGTITEEIPTSHQAYAARVYYLQLPEGNKRRIIRVIRTKKLAIYQSLERAFLAANTRDQAEFFDKLTIAKR